MPTRTPFTLLAAAAVATAACACADAPAGDSDAARLASPPAADLDPAGPPSRPDPLDQLAWLDPADGPGACHLPHCDPDLWSCGPDCGSGGLACATGERCCSGKCCANQCPIVVACGGGSTCPGASPCDQVPDDAALQQCLDQGGVIRLTQGSPGYIIHDGLRITRDGTTLTSTGTGRPTLIAHADLIQPILSAVNRDGTVIENLRLDGDKWRRTTSGSCGQAPAGANLTVHGATSRNFLVRNVESVRAMCGTALGASGSNFEVTGNLIDDAGFMQGERAGTPWADGITTSQCVGGWIHGNTLRNSTDVAIAVGGGGNCLVENNTVVQSGRHAVAGLAVVYFDEGIGEHAGSLFRNNSISSSYDGLDFGISVGPHAWNQNQSAFHGTITGNTATGAVVNLAVDGYYNGTVTGNSLAGPQGTFNGPLIRNCGSFSANYTAAHFTGSTIDPGWIARSYHNGTCQ